MKQLPYLFLNELRRMRTLWWSYRLSAISSLLLHAAIFPVLMLLFQNLADRHGAAYGSSRQLDSLLGFLVWYLCMKLLSAMPRMIEEEARVGTLATLFLSPWSLLQIVLLRTAVLALRYFGETAVLALLLTTILQLPLPLTPLSWLIIFLTLIGTVGIGLALTGLALVYKSVGPVVTLFSNLALLVSGALIPIHSMPTVFTVLKFTFPTVWGIELLRKTAVSSSGVVYLPGLFLQTMIFICTGVWGFAYALAQTRHLGNLSTH